MHSTVKNLLDIKNNIKIHLNKLNIKNNPKIIAVSKTFKIDKISPLIEYGHEDYGENKVQEALEKWTEMKKTNSKIRLHMIGKLQTNKAKKAVQLFDFIHSLDNIKLATKINQYEKELNKKVKLFIQVNVANEEQKSGVQLNNLNNFYEFCTKNLSLNIIGLMCLPPISSDPSKYFEVLKKKSVELNLPDLSIGMSGDYDKAILFGSTYLRLGTAIFGERNI